MATRTLRWLRRRWPLVLVLAMLAVAWYIPTGWLILAPGQVFPLIGQVSMGGPETGGLDVGGQGTRAVGGAPSGGEVLLLTVSATRANPYRLAAWRAGLIRTSALVPEAAMIPPGMSDAQYIEYSYDQMTESVGLAAVVALREAGYQATASGSGVRVLAVPPGSDNPKLLQPGDVIVTIGGFEVAMSGDIAPLLRGRLPGSMVQMSVLRDGAEAATQASLYQAVPGAEEAMLGAVIATLDPVFALPFAVTVDTKEVGGPSGGLALALAIYQQLGTEDVLHGRTVAASGFVRADGSVGPVGGVRWKAIAAERAGASLLLVAPANGAEARAAGTGITVAEVASFLDALTYLRSIGEGSAR